MMERVNGDVFEGWIYGGMGIRIAYVVKKNSNCKKYLPNIKQDEVKG